MKGRRREGDRKVVMGDNRRRPDKSSGEEMDENVELMTIEQEKERKELRRKQNKVMERR